MGRLRPHQLSKLPEAKRYDLLDAMRDRLRELLVSGDFDGDPDSWLPASEIVALAYAPGTNQTLKFMCLKTAADLVHIPKSAQMKIDAGIQGDTNITVVVQPWAAQMRGPSEPADEPREVLAIASDSSRSQDDKQS